MKLPVKRILRISAYGFLATAIICTTVILVAVGQGYHFDWRSGRLEAGGLLVAESQPESAEVRVDGQLQNKSTPSRLRLTAGVHNLAISADGYRPWQKNLTISAGAVSWLRYPLLIPQKIQPVKITQVNGISHFGQSPDQRLLAWVTEGSSPTAYLLEIGKNQPQTLYKLSSAQIKQGFNISDFQWAADSRHFMITLQNSKGSSHLVVDSSNPDNSISVENELAIRPNNLRFSPADWQTLYWLDSGNLRIINLADSSISDVLARNVQSAELYNDEIYLIQTVGSTRRVISIKAGASPMTVVDNLPGADYELKHLVWASQRHLALLNKSQKLVSLYDPNSQSQQSTGRFETVNATKLLVSPNNRLLVMQNKNSFASYDFDQEKLQRFDIRGRLSGSVSWFDNFHLLAIVDGRSTLLEFDGQNDEALIANSANWPVFASRDGKWFYHITQDKQNLYLSQVPLLINR